MTREETQERYFHWMCDLIGNRPKARRGKVSYGKLLAFLHSVDFYYTVPMDSNREGDGVNLRYRYGYDEGVDDYVVASALDDRPCSVLEMMVALCLRCEESIMDDPEVGNRTGQWFWEMIDSLGMSDMTDHRFSKKRAELIIGRFLKREYDRDGRGGLVTINDCQKDMRREEIWYQMMWHLDEASDI